jgi:hypothetical protein
MSVATAPLGTTTVDPFGPINVPPVGPIGALTRSVVWGPHERAMATSDHRRWVRMRCS